jgi:hypothetical protein
LEELVLTEFYNLRMGTTNSEMIIQLLLGNGLRDGPIGAFRRTVGPVEAVMKAPNIAELLRIAAVTNVESIHT